MQSTQLRMQEAVIAEREYDIVWLRIRQRFEERQTRRESVLCNERCCCRTRRRYFSRNTRFGAQCQRALRIAAGGCEHESCPEQAAARRNSPERTSRLHIEGNTHDR